MLESLRFRPRRGPERFRYFWLWTTVWSSLGYEVSYEGRFDLVYRSAVDRCVIPCEMLLVGASLTLAVYDRSMVGDYSITRDEILARVRRAAEFAGWHLEFDE